MRKRIGEFLTRHPRGLVLLGLTLMLAALAGLPRAHLVTDYRVFFDHDDPNLIAYERMEKRFGGTDDVLLAIQPAAGSALTPRYIRRLGALTDALRDTPYADRVTSVADMPLALKGANGPQITTLLALAQADTLDKPLWDKAVAEAARFTTGTLLAPDHSMIAAHVTLNLPRGDTYGDTAKVYDYTEKVRAQFEKKYPDEKVLLAGVLPYYHAIMDLAFHDVLLLMPVVLLVAIFMLRSLLGSWRATLACGMPVLFAVGTTAGLNCWLGFTVTTATIITPIVVLVIALAYVVHFADTWLQVRAEHPDAASAAQYSFKENWRPALLTAGTTIVGFLAMNNSVSPPYRTMGNITAIGVGLAVLYAMFLMPALLTWLDPPYWRKRGPLRRALDKLADFITRPIRSKWLLGAAAVVVLGLLACIPLNRVGDNISQWFGGDTRLRQDNIIVDTRLTGMQQLYFELPAPGPDGVASPKYLHTVQQFVDWLHTQPRVAAVRALPQLVRAMARVYGDGKAVIPANADETAQLLYLYEFAAPPGNRANGLLAEDRQSSLVHVSLHNRSGGKFLAFNNRARAWLAKNAPELHAPSGYSGVLMFSRMAHDNIAPMISSTVLVLLFTALVVAFALRSKRMGVISILPNLLPIGLAFGVWGLISSHVGIALSVISTAALGIIVDDTIHMLERYQEARKGGFPEPAAACREAIRRVGGAITTTSMVLCVGIGLIGFSSLQPTHELGVWLAIAVAFAWLNDLILLPQLLSRFDR